jgi:DNA polymerase III epsilon subunit-like protein
MGKTLFVLDLETTGLQPTDACIWEIAAVAVRDGEILGEFQSRVQPRLEHFTARHREIPKRISGLDDTALLWLLDAAPAREVSQVFRKWVVDTSQTEIMGISGDWSVTSYKASFEQSFLREYPWGLDSPIAWADCLKLRSFEAMKAANACPVGQRDPRWPKLGEACAYFGVPFSETHSALNDARAAAGLYLALEARQ